MINRIRRNGRSAAFLPGILPDMAQPPDLEARVAALENRVEELTQRVQGSERDAAAARVLAGGADRDVEQIRGEIRDFKQATTASFNAMREDINDLRTEVRNGFAEVDRGFIEIRGRLDATAAGIEQIATMLERGR
jgi:methyl-accepting chemotaxis protein